MRDLVHPLPILPLIPTLHSISSPVRCKLLGLYNIYTSLRAIVQALVANVLQDTQVVMKIVSHVHFYGSVWYGTESQQKHVHRTGAALNGSLSSEALT